MQISFNPLVPAKNVAWDFDENWCICFPQGSEENILQEFRNYSFLEPIQKKKQGFITK